MTSFNVAGLLHEPPGSTRDVRLRDHYLSLGPDVELAGPLDADLRLQRTNRGLLLRGDARAPLRRTCARCADPFVEDVGVDINEEFLPSVDPDSGVVLGEPTVDESALRIDARHEIDLDPVLHDELALTEPMHPLCRPECPGLCPECGERLDRDEHAHGGDEIDPRLAGLAALLRDGDRGDREG
ncbi:MAG: YceD family protein [Candidatus Limnocylindria bacterium]